MQAISSGVYYVCREARRAIKPIVETLAPIIPTFADDEAAVKQSLGHCIHKLESSSIDFNAQTGNIPLWGKSFSNIRKIVLYPASRQSQLNEEQGCRVPNQDEWAIWKIVTSNINHQLESWSLPFRFNISTEPARLGPLALNASANECLADSNVNDRLLAVFVRHCDNPLVDGKPVGGSLDRCLASIRSGQSKSVYAHELAHTVSTHAFSSTPLTSLHPDVLDAMCDPGAHGDELITSLSYGDRCNEVGYPNTGSHLDYSRGQWGPLDLTMAKRAMNQERDANYTQIHAEGVDQSYEWIKQNYGGRAAEHFAASFAKSVFIHSMSAIVARTVKNEIALACYRTIIHLLGNLIHLGMMGQLNPSPYLQIGQLCASSGLMGRIAKALAGVIGEAAILDSFVRLMRGNTDAMLPMVYAICGTDAGNLFSSMILGFIDMCAPAQQEQRQAYLDLTRPSTLFGAPYESCITFAATMKALDPNKIGEKIVSRMPTIVQCIVTIDAAVADVIENYVSLRVMTSWLWKTDQQKADAEVHASVHQLSKTIDEVSIDFGHADLPSIPAPMRRLQAAQTLPTVEPLESTDNDPLPSIDVAAVTGIGTASRSKNQPALQAKKQQ